MSLTTYFHDPFFDTASVFPDFNRWFDAAYDARTSGPSNREVATPSDGGLLRPRMDLHESKDKNEVTAIFELPGMKKDEVTIDVHNNRLVVSGHSSSLTELDKDGYAIRERRYGKFTRALPLPAGIKPEQIKANMENGVLMVKFPKSTPDQEPKKISIA